ncbi:MAG TPA: hypothetical protein VK176_09215 [Phycisphaerales bacterium]|nr:hypothetical protein [Phycisphaerales bacterium]
MTGMTLWDNDFMDAEVPAFIEFRGEGRGAFQFGYVSCQIDWQSEPRQGRSGAVFTFEGNDEMDPTSGRGWAAIGPDGSLVGKLHFHRGDTSGFSAVRKR